MPWLCGNRRLRSANRTIVEPQSAAPRSEPWRAHHPVLEPRAIGTTPKPAFVEDFLNAFGINREGRDSAKRRYFAAAGVHGRVRVRIRRDYGSVKTDPFAAPSKSARALSRLKQGFDSPRERQ
jgi:hypothetical protein